MIERAARKTNNFYVLDKKISEDQRLTWAARGLLIFLLGKPDGWKVSLAYLIKQTGLSRSPLRRDGLYVLLNELIATGYARREQRRDDQGRMSTMDYIVSEEPGNDENIEATPLLAKPITEKPITEKPLTEKPDALSSNKYKQGLNKASIDKKASNASEFEKQKNEQPKTEAKPNLVDLVTGWYDEMGYQEDIHGHLEHFMVRLATFKHFPRDLPGYFKKAILEDWAGLRDESRKIPDWAKVPDGTESGDPGNNLCKFIRAHGYPLRLEMLYINDIRVELKRLVAARLVEHRLQQQLAA